ncbi:MAG: NAD(P)/FAD-dependent oxidoreductase [Planctomycetota bacterium]|nr:NAD(P)/FAD-dependent oxidoreductase [Planctomycetota bacterium]
MTSYDIIVIGGGHNGLTTAALLAARGRKVVLLERQAVLGGLAVGDEFHPGFTSAGLLHDTSVLRGHLVEALDLARNGLALTAQPPAVFSPQDPDRGPGLLLHHDPAEAAGEIEAHSAADVQRYGEYRAFIERIRSFAGRLFDTEPPALVGPAASTWSLLRRGLALRRLGRRDMMELLRIGPMCVADWMNEWFESELLRCTLASPALTGTSAGPWSPGTAANLLRLESLAGRAVGAGPAALICALEQAARRHGVDVRLESEVRHIRTAGGAVEGVDLTDGEPIDTRVVAASCDPKQTFLKLLSPPAITPKLHHQIGTLRCRGSTAKVDLALRGPLRFSCRPELEIEHARVAETIDDMERASDAIKYGRCSEIPVLDVYVPSPPPPEHDGEDRRVVSIVAHFAPHDLASGWTDTERERLGDTVVATLARYAPDLQGRIIARRVLTPVDIEARYGVTGGHIHHVEHALDQMIVRPAPQCARYATPIRGLYLCGSGSHPGGGLTGAPGALAAAAVLRGW